MNDRLAIFSIGCIVGSAGLIPGFYLPIFLNPGANQGPFLGLFVTGPTSFVCGIIIGIVFQIFNFKRVTKIIILSPIVTAIICWTTVLSLPEDLLLSRNISGEILHRSNPIERLNSRIKWWDELIKNEAYIRPTLDWKGKIKNIFETEQGCLVTVNVHALRMTNLRKRPWNSGDTIVIDKGENGREELYIRGCSCSEIRETNLDYNVIEVEFDSVSPPLNIAAFLGVNSLYMKSCDK